MLIPQEENGRAALLLEQAAYALLCLPMPAKRKFAFQMVRAHGGLADEKANNTTLFDVDQCSFASDVIIIHGLRRSWLV